jgi:hypothetical protein
MLPLEHSERLPTRPATADTDARSPIPSRQTGRRLESRLRSACSLCRLAFRTLESCLLARRRNGLHQLMGSRLSHLTRASKSSTPRLDCLGMLDLA